MCVLQKVKFISGSQLLVINEGFFFSKFVCDSVNSTPSGNQIMKVLPSKICLATLPCIWSFVFFF